MQPWCALKRFLSKTKNLKDPKLLSHHLYYLFCHGIPIFISNNVLLVQIFFVS